MISGHLRERNSVYMCFLGALHKILTILCQIWVAFEIGFDWVIDLDKVGLYPLRSLFDSDMKVRAFVWKD